MTDIPGSTPVGNPPAIVENPGSQPWYATIENPEVRGFAELKKWDSPAAAIESYRNLEGKLGAPPERLLKLPEKGDDPAWQDIYSKVGLGRPEKPEDYGIAVPEGIPPEYAQHMSKIAHDAGVPKKMLDALVKANAEFATAEEARIQAQEKVASDQAIAGLKSTWGGLYDQNVELARRSAAEMGVTVGLDTNKLQAIEGAIGTADFLRLFAAVGSKNHQEGRVLEGSSNPTFGPMSPEAATAKFNLLIQNPEWSKKAMTPGTAEHAERIMLSNIRAGAKV